MKMRGKKVVAWLLMLVMVIGIMPLAAKTVKAANYSYNKGSVTINSDGSVTIDFTLAEVDQTQVLYGFGLCLFEEKPDLLDNDKLVNSGNTFYDSDVCKHVYHQELAEPIPEGTYNDTFQITYPAGSLDIVGFDTNGGQISRDAGLNLKEALDSGKDWYIVVGVRTSFGGVQHTNCDLYLGQVSDITGGDNFVPHEHHWNYGVKENKIYAWCDSEKLKCEYYATNQDDAKLLDTLTADDMVYTGEPYVGGTVTNNIADVTGATMSTITYYNSNGDVLDTPPTNVGDYYVTVTLTDGQGGAYTAKDTFTITPVDISSGTINTDITDKNNPPATIKITLDGKERTLTVGTDCDIVFDDADPSKVKVVGKGNYTGTITTEIKKDNSSLTNGGATNNTNGGSATNISQGGSTNTTTSNTATTTSTTATNTTATNTVAENTTVAQDDEDVDEEDADDEEDEDDEDAIDTSNGNSGSTTSTTSYTTTGGSPVTGYDGIVRVMMIIMMIGLAGTVASARKLKENTK
jgi:hypothetical protein